MRLVNSGVTAEQPHLLQRKETDLPGTAKQLPLLWRIWMASVGGNKSHSCVRALLPSPFWHCCLKGNLSNEGWGGHGHSSLEPPQKPAACCTLQAPATTPRVRKESMGLQPMLVGQIPGVHRVHLTLPRLLASAQQGWRGFLEWYMSLPSSKEQTSTGLACSPAQHYSCRQRACNKDEGFTEWVCKTGQKAPRWEYEFGIKKRSSMRMTLKSK